VKNVIAICLAFLMPLQTAPASQRKKTDAPAVRRAKQVLISSFDGLLPNLTLQSFLEYETGDLLTEWSDRECNAGELGSSQDKQFRAPTCVETESSLPDQRVVRVVVEVSANVSVSVRLISVEIIDNGLALPVRLIELPAVIHLRGKPRSPRDLPPVVGTSDDYYLQTLANSL
jgi:hypothetical protein